MRLPASAAKRAMKWAARGSISSTRSRAKRCTAGEVASRYSSGQLGQPGGDRGPSGALTAGALIGLALFAGYGFQTVGLQYTTASNAGFITGLSVVLTPLLGALLLRQAPGRWPATGACVAAIGLALLSLQRLEVRRGDALVRLLREEPDLVQELMSTHEVMPKGRNFH